MVQQIWPLNNMSFSSSKKEKRNWGGEKKQKRGWKKAEKMPEWPIFGPSYGPGCWLSYLTYIGPVVDPCLFSAQFNPIIWSIVAYYWPILVSPIFGPSPGITIFGHRCLPLPSMATITVLYLQLPSSSTIISKHRRCSPLSNRHQ